MTRSVHTAAEDLVFRSEVVGESFEDHAGVVVKTAGDAEVLNERDVLGGEVAEGFLDAGFFGYVAGDLPDLVEGFGGDEGGEGFVKVGVFDGVEGGFQEVHVAFVECGHDFLLFACVEVPEHVFHGACASWGRGGRF